MTTTKDNAVVCAYGPSKTGKTTDCLYSFPRGLFLAQPGALKPSENVVGYTPKSELVQTIPEATALILKQKKGEFDALVVDDFSLLAENTIAIAERKASGLKMWGVLRDWLIEFRQAARYAGMHVVCNAHESAPKVVNNASLRGGPKLPGRMVEDFPAICDLVIRAAPEPDRKGWPYGYRCSGNDANYITGDRHGVTPDHAPMNLAEILRAAGYAVRRAPGLEWQDEVVESLTQLFEKNPNVDQVELMRAVVGKMREKGRSDIHIRWVLRDALDRMNLRLANSNPLAAFGL